MGGVDASKEWACWSSSSPGVCLWSADEFEEFLVTDGVGVVPDDQPALQGITAGDAACAEPASTPPIPSVEAAAVGFEKFPELVLILLDEDLVPLHLLSTRDAILADESSDRLDCRWCSSQLGRRCRRCCRNGYCRRHERLWRNAVAEVRREWRVRCGSGRRGPMPTLKQIPACARRLLQSL